jgi:hypothetical protein
MFGDLKRRPLDIDLLANEEGLLGRLHDAATPGATGGDVVDHLVRYQQGTFVLEMSRLSPRGALRSAVGRGRFGRLDNVGRRRFGGSGRILLGLGKLFLQEVDLLLQLAAWDLDRFQLLTQLRTTDTKLFGLPAHVSLS